MSLICKELPEVDKDKKQPLNRKINKDSSEKIKFNGFQTFETMLINQNNRHANENKISFLSLKVKK